MLPPLEETLHLAEDGEEQKRPSRGNSQLGAGETVFIRNVSLCVQEVDEEGDEEGDEDEGLLYNESEQREVGGTKKQMCSSSIQKNQSFSLSCNVFL